MDSTRMCRCLLPSVALLCVLAAAGCIVIPVRTPTVTQNPAGQKVPLPAFTIVPGQTTRQQVEKQFQGFAVASGASNLFWGRFRKSSWWFVGGVGGMGGAAVGSGRTWGTYNLLVLFDDNGTVRTSELVRDKVLIERFTTMCRQQELPALDLSHRVKLLGSSAPGPVVFELELSAGGMTASKQRPVVKIRKQFVLPPAQVASIPHAAIAGIEVNWTEEAFQIPVTVRFTEKTAIGKRIRFNTTPGAVLTLVRWQQQAKSEH